MPPCFPEKTLGGKSVCPTAGVEVMKFEASVCVSCLVLIGIVCEIQSCIRAKSKLKYITIINSC